MEKNVLIDKLSGWRGAILCVLLAVLGLYLTYNEPSKVLSLIAGAGMLVIFIFGDLKRLRNWPTVFLCAYVVFAMLTIFWAMSGKFFLQQYTKIFIASALFLFAAVYGRTKGFARLTMGALAGMSAIYGALAVLGASIPAFSEWYNGVANFGGTLKYSNRMWGIMANSNIEAAISALGVFLSLALLCDSEDKKRRIVWAVALYCNAVALLLGFSMGALFFFAISVVVYLIFAGKGRAAALPRMLDAAVPAVLCGVVMIHFYQSETLWLALPVFLVGMAASVALELKLAERAAMWFEPRQKAVFGVLIGLIAAVGVFALVALNLSAPYTFGGDLNRGMRLAAGEHTLTVEANGDVTVRVASYTDIQVATRRGVDIYEGSADGARFTVPEGSYVCDFVFSADEGTTLQSASVDGKTLVLRYKILPAFAANRISGGAGTRANSAQRIIYIRDGLRLVKLSPWVGNGVGCFETGCTAVQDYYYGTRYVHNHYLQILIDSGIIGLVLFCAALIALAVTLWKKRKFALEGELRWLYPALCAEFSMSILHMIWDVFMSILLSMMFIFTVYGLIVGLFADPIPAKEPESVGKKKKATPSRSNAPERLALMLVPMLFVLSILGNMYAKAHENDQFESYEAAYQSMERAMKIDLYERNDAKLSYVLTVQEDESGDAPYWRANQLAAELSKVQSNRIPGYLTAYYFNTEQYALAIEEAKLGATYSASDVTQWDAIADCLKQGFIDNGAASPLLREGGGALLDKLVEYADMFERYNAASPVPLVVDENTETFFRKVRELEEYRDVEDGMLYVLLSE